MSEVYCTAYTSQCLLPFDPCCTSKISQHFPNLNFITKARGFHGKDSSTPRFRASLCIHLTLQRPYLHVGHTYLVSFVWFLVIKG